MALNKKIESLILRIKGHKTPTIPTLPKVSDELNAQFNELVNAINIADKKWQDALDRHFGSENDYQKIENATVLYPDLPDALAQRDKARQAFESFCIQHPELWRPGLDVAWFFDFNKLKLQITEMYHSEMEYLNELNSKANALQNQFHQDGANSPELLNSCYFYLGLLEDIQQTIGDKINTLWWNTIPDVIKKKYSTIMDITMIQILSTNDKLANFVLNFDTMKQDPKKCKNFLKLLISEMNKHLAGAIQSAKFAMATKEDFNICGQYNVSEDKVIVALRQFNHGIDEVIRTIKHEYLGHHIDNVSPNAGLMGESMKNFIQNEIGCLKSHGDRQTWHYTLQSPLLHEYYYIDDISDDVLKALYDMGWKRVRQTDKFEYENYRNQFSERSAWAVGESCDIVTKVKEYRDMHGLTFNQKSK